MKRKLAQLAVALVLASTVAPALLATTPQCAASGSPLSSNRIGYWFDAITWPGTYAAYLNAHQSAYSSATDVATSAWNDCGFRFEKSSPYDYRFWMAQARGPNGQCADEGSADVKYFSWPPNDPDSCSGVETAIALQETGHIMGLQHTGSQCSGHAMQFPADGTAMAPSTNECNWTEDAYGEEEEEPLSPLVLNLDGREIATTSVDLDPVFFDLSGDGVRDQVGWISPRSADAFLWLDLNDNGQVEGGGELFGNRTLLPNGEYAEDGFQALAAYDTNGDRKIVPTEPVWERLALWDDWDHDGAVSPNEITRLADTDIVGISTRANKRRWVDDAGNVHYRVGVFWRRDGERGRVEDLWFQIREG